MNFTPGFEPAGSARTIFRGAARLAMVHLAVVHPAMVHLAMVHLAGVHLDWGSKGRGLWGRRNFPKFHFYGPLVKMVREGFFLARRGRRWGLSTVQYFDPSIIRPRGQFEA